MTLEVVTATIHHMGRKSSQPMAHMDLDHSETNPVTFEGTIDNLNGQKFTCASPYP